MDKLRQIKEGQNEHTTKSCCQTFSWRKNISNVRWSRDKFVLRRKNYINAINSNVSDSNTLHIAQPRVYIFESASQISRI